MIMVYSEGRNQLSTIQPYYNFVSVSPISDSREGCPYEVRGLKFVWIFERRTKFAPTVCKTNFSEDFMLLTRQRCVEVADIYKIRGNKIVQTSRADNIRPYAIMLICNITIVAYHRYLHQNPILQSDIHLTLFAATQKAYPSSPGQAFAL